MGSCLSPAAALTAALALLIAARPGLAWADEGDVESTSPSSFGPALHPRLTVDLPVQAAVTGGMLLASGVSLLLTDRLAAPACRWCEPNPLDRWARRELRWTNVAAANTSANLVVYAIPVGGALTLGLFAHADGAGTREVVEDLLVVTEAASLTLVLTQASKFTTGRLRPDAWASGGGTTADSRMSFWGGHAAFAFSVAASTTQVARLRGRTGWRWLGLASFVAAGTTAWLRVSADRHWLTDVVVGAGVGTAVGFAVPLLVLRPAGEQAAAVTLAPAPGGFVLHF